MSQGQRQRVTVTLDDLVAQLELIRAEVSRLKDLLAQLTAERNSIVVAKDTIDAIARSGQGTPLLFPLSTSPVAFVEATAINKDKVIIHLGADVYAKLDVSEGLKMLSEEESNYNRAIEEVSKRLSELENLQAQYEAVIQQALGQAQASGARAERGQG